MDSRNDSSVRVCVFVKLHMCMYVYIIYICAHTHVSIHTSICEWGSGFTLSNAFRFKSCVAQRTRQTSPKSPYLILVAHLTLCAWKCLDSLLTPNPFKRTVFFLLQLGRKQELAWFVAWCRFGAKGFQQWVFLGTTGIERMNSFDEKASEQLEHTVHICPCPPWRSWGLCMSIKLQWKSLCAQLSYAMGQLLFGM